MRLSAGLTLRAVAEARYALGTRVILTELRRGRLPTASGVVML